MIKKLRIERFKQLLNFEADLSWLNIFLGANNSGKSSVLQAIHFFVSVAQSRRLLDGRDITSLVEGDKYSGTIAPQQIIYTPAQDMMWIAHGGNLTQNVSSSIIVSVTLSGPIEGELRVRRGRNRNIAIEMKGAEVIQRLENIEEPFSIFVPGLAGLAKTESYIARGSMLRSLARGDSNLILRNVLDSLHQNRTKWDSFINDLVEIFPNLTIKVTSHPDIDEHIEVSVASKHGDLPIDYAGTGVLQTIQILAYINLFKPTVTLLDEPDSHLHPNNQRALAKKLLEFTEKRKTQVILATHSRHILDAFGSKPKYIWVADGAAQSVSDHIEILKELGALDRAEGLLARGIKCVILSEDSDTRPVELIAQRYLPADSMLAITYKGCSNKIAVEAMCKFIREVSPTVRIIIHRDSDYMEDDFISYWREYYSSVGANGFFTKGVNIESYFARKRHLKKVNRGSASIINELYETAIDELEDDIRKKARNGREESRNQRVRAGLSTVALAEIFRWSKNFDIQEERWINGKLILPKLRKMFRGKTGHELTVFSSSEFLEDGTDKNVFNPPVVRRPQPVRRKVHR